MSDREERERLRQQRLAQQQSQGSSDRRRLILGYVTAGLLAAAVVAGLVAVIAGGSDGDGETISGDCENASIATDYGYYGDFECDNREGTTPPELQFGDLEESAQKAGCDLNLDLPDEGNGHFTDLDQGTYETNPPTSGDHYSVPDETGSGALADGAFLDAPPESRLVHAMEHGRVVVRYSPKLPEDQQLAIKGIFDEDPGGVILIPDPDLPGDAAVSAWNNSVVCASYDPLALDVIRNFRDTYRGNGPENVPH